MLDALREDNLDEKIIVTISPENYETLKFWVIGMDVVPIDDQPWNEMTKTMTNFLNQRSRRLDPLAKIWYEKTLLTQISSKLQKKVTCYICFYVILLHFVEYILTGSCFLIIIIISCVLFYGFNIVF